jgi:large subunit ribosomal protein L4e
MYAPNRVWRRWHRKVNIKIKRYAVCSALAASAIPALVAARGHRIGRIAEIPLVIDTASMANVKKTKKAVELLKNINVYDDIEKVKSSKKIRAGRGKMRNRRYVQRLGPLVIFKERTTMIRAMRNIPGIDFACVDRLNLLQLAPGGHLGRLIIWTKDAFCALDTIYGTYKTKAARKRFALPRPKMQNTDIARILNSDEIQSVIRPRMKRRWISRKRNPLKNNFAMEKLNPYAIIRKRNLFADKLKAKAIKEGTLKPKRVSKVAKPANAKTVAAKVSKKLSASALKLAHNKKFRKQRKAFAKSLFA